MKATLDGIFKKRRTDKEVNDNLATSILYFTILSAYYKLKKGEDRSELLELLKSGGNADAELKTITDKLRVNDALQETLATRKQFGGGQRLSRRCRRRRRRRSCRRRQIGGDPKSRIMGWFSACLMMYSTAVHVYDINHLVKIESGVREYVANNATIAKLLIDTIDNIDGRCGFNTAHFVNVPQAKVEEVQRAVESKIIRTPPEEMAPNGFGSSGSEWDSSAISYQNDNWDSITESNMTAICTTVVESAEKQMSRTLESHEVVITQFGHNSGLLSGHSVLFLARRENESSSLYALMDMNLFVDVIFRALEADNLLPSSNPRDYLGRDLIGGKFIYAQPNFFTEDQLRADNLGRHVTTTPAPLKNSTTTTLPSGKVDDSVHLVQLYGLNDGGSHVKNKLGIFELNVTRMERFLEVQHNITEIMNTHNLDHEGIFYNNRSKEMLIANINLINRNDTVPYNVVFRTLRYLLKPDPISYDNKTNTMSMKIFVSSFASRILGPEGMDEVVPILESITEIKIYEKGPGALVMFFDILDDTKARAKLNKTPTLRYTIPVSSEKPGEQGVILFSEPVTELQNAYNNNTFIYEFVRGNGTKTSLFFHFPSTDYEGFVVEAFDATAVMLTIFELQRFGINYTIAASDSTISPDTFADLQIPKSHDSIKLKTKIPSSSLPLMSSMSRIVLVTKTFANVEFDGGVGVNVETDDDASREDQVTIDLPDLLNNHSIDDESEIDAMQLYSADQTEGVEFDRDESGDFVFVGTPIEAIEAKREKFKDEGLASNHPDVIALRNLWKDEFRRRNGRIPNTQDYAMWNNFEQTQRRGGSGGGGGTRGGGGSRSRAVRNKRRVAKGTRKTHF